MEGVTYSNERVNTIMWQVYRQLPYLKQRVAVIYEEVINKGNPCCPTALAELSSVTDTLWNCHILFDIPTWETDASRSGRLQESWSRKRSVGPHF